uniref:Uncharacterized protein n=1 Tax=Romanomermis culicivorax TaxID=13658 RepID=A0A915K8P3_ROMCU
MSSNSAFFYDDDGEILTQNLGSSFVADEKSLSNLSDPVASSTAQKQKLALEDSLISLQKENHEETSLSHADGSNFNGDLISFVDENQLVDEHSLISNFSVDSELLKNAEPSWKKTFVGEEFSLKDSNFVEIGNKSEFFKAEEAKTLKNHPFIQGADLKNCDTSAWSLGPSSLADDSRFSAISRTAYFGAGSEPLETACFENLAVKRLEKTFSDEPCSPKKNVAQKNGTKNSISSKKSIFASEKSTLDSKNRQSEICFDEIRRIIDQIPNSENVSMLVETILKAKNELELRKKTPSSSILTSLENQQKIEETPTNGEKFSLETGNPSTPQCNLFTNKRLLSFGCTELSEKSLQYFLLKNNSQSEILRFKLTLHQRRSDENPENKNFQIMNPDADGYILLHPKETLQFKILFKPDEVKFYNAKILISTVNHPQRLCIPIFGYGGSCSLNLKNFPLTKRAFHDVNFDLHRRKTRIFQLYNKGSLAGFFHILLYEDPGCSTFLRGKDIKVHPTRGVIPSNQSMDISVTIDSTTSLPILGNAFGHMVICYGEEISRQRLKKWEDVKCKKFLIKERSFTREKFDNEENNDENLYRPEDPQQAVVKEEAQLFLGHLREIHFRLSPSPELYNDDSSCGSSFFPIPLDNSHLAVSKIFFSSISVAPKMITFVDTNVNARDT